MSNNNNDVIDILNSKIKEENMIKNYNESHIGQSVYIIGSNTYTSLEKKYEIVNILPNNLIELKDGSRNNIKIKSNRCIPSNEINDGFIEEIKSKNIPNILEKLKSIEFLDGQFIFRNTDFIKKKYFNIFDQDLYIISSGNKNWFLAYSIKDKDEKLFRSLENFKIYFSDILLLKL